MTPSWSSHFRRREGAAAAVPTAGEARGPRPPLVKRRGEMYCTYESRACRYPWHHNEGGESIDTEERCQQRLTLEIFGILSFNSGHLFPPTATKKQTRKRLAVCSRSLWPVRVAYLTNHATTCDVCCGGYQCRYLGSRATASEGLPRRRRRQKRRREQSKLLSNTYFRAESRNDLGLCVSESVPKDNYEARMSAFLRLTKTSFAEFGFQKKWRKVD